MQVRDIFDTVCPKAHKEKIRRRCGNISRKDVHSLVGIRPKLAYKFDGQGSRKVIMVEAVMTDYQFRSIVKLVKKIVDKCDTKEEISAELEELLEDSKKKNSD